MIYLDNAATTMPKPPGVYEAVQKAMHQCASLGRSGHAAAQNAAETAYACRTAAGKMFDADPERVVFTMNATHALNLAIHSSVAPGDEVVVSGFEHNAVLRPLYHLHANVKATAGTFNTDQILASFTQAIGPKTKAVVCTHVSNVFGYVMPLEEIAAICAEREVPLIIDAAQSAGVLPLSMKKTHAAFIAMPGHKSLLGPQGTGMLLCGTTPEPLLQGGTGSLSQSMSMPDFLPDRAEAGTHNIPGIAGLLEGLRFIDQMGLTKICVHEQQLTHRLSERLSAIRGVTVFDAPPQAGVLSFTADGEDCEVLSEKLADRGFAVRSGLHCAPLAHASAGTLKTGTVRASVSVFNTLQEIDDFADCLLEILQV